jgi:signal transduction histidine kinase
MDKKKTSSTKDGMDFSSDRLGPATAQFIAIFSHELRNPITCLCYLVHHLLNIGSRDNEAVEIYPILRRQVDHLVYLVDTMTDCSWFDCGELSLKTELVEINDLIRQALEMTRPIMDERHHQVDMVNSHDPIYLTADPNRLLQVLANLLQNAAKYTPHAGKIHIRVDQQPNKLAISIKDNGIGMDGELLPRIFDFFTRSDEASSLCRGAGIGLGLVKRLVSAHSGTVEGRSNGQGQGSEFIVSLPI